MVKYAYDAWGNCLTTVQDVNATGIADLNPFRYRGYYYDSEIGMYYLQSRYGIVSSFFSSILSVWS